MTTDRRITDLAAQTGTQVEGADLFVTVDLSDTSMAGSGTDKKISATELASALTALITALPQTAVDGLVTALLSKVDSAGAGLTKTGTALALAGSGVTPGTYGDGTHVAQLTVSDTGVVTSATSVAVTSGSANPFITNSASGISTIRLQVGTQLWDLTADSSGALVTTLVSSGSTNFLLAAGTQFTLMAGTSFVFMN